MFPYFTQQLVLATTFAAEIQQFAITRELGTWILRNPICLDRRNERRYREAPHAEGTHAFAPVGLAAFVPRGHFLHTVDPAVSENVPAGQGRQRAFPNSLATVPGGHGIHTEKFILERIPGGQSLQAPFWMPFPLVETPSQAHFELSK